MNGATVDNSLTRIEAALARIEAAASRPRSGEADDGALRARHDSLREAVGQSLRDLDQIIAGRMT